MRTLNILCVTFAVALLNSCNLHKNITYKEEPKISTESVHYNRQNYREYKEQETIYYQYVLKNNSVKIKKDNEVPSKKEKSTSETINHKKDLIQTLENKGLKPCKFVEKRIKKEMYIDSVHLSEAEKERLVNDEETTSPKIKKKARERCGNLLTTVGKILSTGYFIFLAFTNFQLFTMVFPTAICLLACICYPIWWKRGYLDTPYAKIATFIAAYGGLFANILWIILYI